MNPNAAVFCPSPSVSSKPIVVASTAHHIQPPPNTKNSYKEHRHSNGAPSVASSSHPLVKTHSANGVDNTVNSYQQSLNQQQLIYQQMQQLTEQGQQLSIRINNVLQPQLSELSDQMQTALFNCNHVTQPEYYAGLQNQHLILTQSMKETQQQYNAVTYQYQYYQHILLQQQQQSESSLQEQYQELQQLYDVSTENNKSKYEDKYPQNNSDIKKTKHPSTKQDIFERKLCVLICKLSPERFDRVLAKMLEFLDHHVHTQNELKMIVDKILKFTLNQPYLASLTAKLFLHFYDYLPRLIMSQQYQQHLWDSNDVDISLTFRKILLVALERLFAEYRGKIDEEDDIAEKERFCTDFLGLMEIVGELYNVDLVHIRVLRKGIFDSLLFNNIYSCDIIDIRAVCVVFKSCGKKLDSLQQRMCDKYLNKCHSLCKNDTSLNMISQVVAIRCNNWVHHDDNDNQKYKTVKYFVQPLDEIREIPFTSPLPSISTSASPKASINVFFKGFARSTQYTLTKCYRYDIAHDSLRIFMNNYKGFVETIKYGYLGSCYILGDCGRLMVCGSNKYGELGIQNEIIYVILKHWCNIEVLDVFYLICTFIDIIRYRCDYIHRNKAKSITNDILDDTRLISSGIASRHRFVLTNSAQLYGAGCNMFNQLGLRKSEYENMKWNKINYFNENNIKLRDIVCGYSTSTFLSENGCIYTVGYSSFGNLGIGDKQNKLSKITKIYTVKTKILSISCGFDHTLAVNEYRYVLSFGDNGFGQLGHGHTIQNRRQKPKEIEYFHKHNLHAIQIGCGAFHSVVLDCEGLVHCFGYNLGYQCHHNNTATDTNISTPKLNNTLHNVDKITNIKCGAFHNVVETQQNEWYLWGDNRNNQCLVDTNKIVVKIPTLYNQNDIPNTESIIDMFPGYDETIIFTTRLTL